MYASTVLVAALLAAAAQAGVVVRRSGTTTPSFPIVVSARASNGSSSSAAASGADFGSCTPTMDFQTGRAQFNRKATEGTFFPTDSNVVGGSGQSDALNPNIITNFICDQLTNVCGANDAAKQSCKDAQAQVQSLGTKDQSTADAFNSAMGF